MKSRTTQVGAITLAAALLYLLAAIAGAIISALVSAWYASDRIAHANRCTSDIVRMMGDERLYRQSVDSGSHDRSLCDQINADVGQFNTTCGEDFGALPTLDCDGDGQPD